MKVEVAVAMRMMVTVPGEVDSRVVVIKWVLNVVVRMKMLANVVKMVVKEVERIHLFAVVMKMDVEVLVVLVEVRW